MPLYEYECKKCGNRFEKIQQFSDAPETICPTCGGDVERLISAPAVQFKGQGWYVTDYAKKGSAAKSAATDSASSEKKTDSASATEAPKPSATEKKS